MDTDTKLRKAHIKLMRHPETCLYSGVILMGKSEIVDDIPTACTDGINKLYGRKFMDNLTESEVAGVVLHENLHVALRQLMRYRGLMKEDHQLANAAMDYVVNDIIMQLKDTTLAKLPQGGLWDVRFRNWSVLEVYDYLRNGNPPPPPPPPKGQGRPCPPGQKSQPLPKGKPERRDDGVKIGNETFKIEGQDKHDDKDIKGATPDEMREVEKQITEALQQGGILAGRMGSKIPRVIKDALTDPIDWAAEMRDFVCTSTAGKSEYTYRKYNRKFLADDIYMPSTEDETISEVIFGIDTSGSIGDQILAVFANRVYEVCQIAKPERVRVLWWDTHVHGEQIFEQNQFDNIKKLLKPQGGGGTHAGCVAQYVKAKHLSADCIVVFTDGYTEQPVDWQGVSCPTLWLVTENKQFQSPPGTRKVKVDRIVA